MDPPWCSYWGRVIKFRPFLLTVGLLYCHFCSWVPIGQAETLTEQCRALMLFLMDILSLSFFKGLRPEYWSTDILPHTQLLLFFLPFTLHRHFPNKSLKYLFSLHLFLTSPKWHKHLLDSSVNASLSECTPEASFASLVLVLRCSNILGFVGYTVSVITTQFCRTKATIDI